MLLLLLAKYPTWACSVYITPTPFKNVAEFELYICTVSTQRLIFLYNNVKCCFKTKKGKVYPLIEAPYVTFYWLQNITLLKLHYFLYMAILHILHCSWMKSGVFWDVTHTVQQIGTIFRYRHQVCYLYNTQNHIPAEHHFHSCHCEKLKSHMDKLNFSSLR